MIASYSPLSWITKSFSSRKASKLDRTICAMSVALSCFLGAGHVHADPQYHTDFEGEAGTLPPGWVQYTNGDIYQIGLDGAGHLVLGTTGSGSLGSRGAALYNGDSSTLSNGSVEVTLTPTRGGNWWGIIGRTQSSDSFSPAGYYALIHESEKVLGIWTTMPSTTASSATSAAIAWVTIPALDSAAQYRLVLEMVGDKQTASIYQMNNSETPFATVSATNSLYSSGGSGLFAMYGGNDRKTIYDNFTLQAIPEPSAKALGLIILGLGVSAYRSVRVTK